MIAPPDRTHDAARRSWVESANKPGTDFPLQNLPLGVFRPRGEEGEGQIGVAIGDRVLALRPLVDAGLFGGPRDAPGTAGGPGESASGDSAAAKLACACYASTLNSLMALGPAASRALRRRLSELLGDDHGALRDDAALVDRALFAQDDVEMLMPAEIGDYTDFYASVHHATNVGSMFRPDNPLLPNYKHIPVGYHGRASSLVVSGTPIVRPHGQTKADDADAPVFVPTRLFDYELEVGAFVGAPNPMGESVPIDRAEEHLFGLCLVNDWSARDVQKWEYQPLGPFLAKSFATTVSPWVVTADALAPFRAPAFTRPAGDPRPLPHLTSEANERQGGFDLVVEAYLCSRAMLEKGMEPHRLSRARFADMYWTPAQMLAHHTSNGCPLRAGDLLASGTVSGPERENRGCMLELTWRGTEPIVLPSGEERRFLQDGDELLLRAFCQREGFARIGFGECRGEVRPARVAS